jgi:hypothetical protein
MKGMLMVIKIIRTDYRLHETLSRCSAGREALCTVATVERFAEMTRPRIVRLRSAVCREASTKRASQGPLPDIKLCPAVPAWRGERCLRAGEREPSDVD